MQKEKLEIIRKFYFGILAIIALLTILSELGVEIESNLV